MIRCQRRQTTMHSTLSLCSSKGKRRCNMSIGNSAIVLYICIVNSNNKQKRKEKGNSNVEICTHLSVWKSDIKYLCYRHCNCSSTCRYDLDIRLVNTILVSQYKLVDPSLNRERLGYLLITRYIYIYICISSLLDINIHIRKQSLASIVTISHQQDVSSSLMMIGCLYDYDV